MWPNHVTIRQICDYTWPLNDVLVQQDRPTTYCASTTMPANADRDQLDELQKDLVGENPITSSVTSPFASESGNQTTRSCQLPQWTLRRPRHWSYRGEGNASIVLALPQEKKIVKLAKIDNKLKRMDSDNQFVAEEVNGGIRTIAQTLERIVFSQKILGTLLGAGLVRPCHVYHVDLDEIDEVDRLIDIFRPAHRKHKRLAPVCHVIVYPDCTLLPASPSVVANGQQQQQQQYAVFCVELKPKQGFLSQGHQHCPFCLNQFLKRKHGKIQLLSQYCPLDLFSGSRHRMLKAILALTRTPQNNLRIFQDGNLVFAEECQTNLLPVLQHWFHLEDTTDNALPLKSFCSLVLDALTVELFDGDIGQPVTDILPEEKNPTDWDSLIDDGKRDHCSPCLPPVSRLPSQSVLNRMLRVQSLGDVDFERLYNAYDDLVDHFRDASLSYDKMRWTHPHMTAEWILNQEPLEQPMDDVRLVQRYRISSTTRDCSIMITFQRLPDNVDVARETEKSMEGSLLLRDLSGHRYKCHASVVDLDPKPVACVEKHRRRNLAMNEAFLAQQQQ